MVAVPSAPKKYIMNRLLRSRWISRKPKDRKNFAVVATNIKKTTNAMALDHLHNSGGIGLMVTKSNPTIERPRGKMELASKSRKRSLSSGDRPFMNRFAAKNDHDAGETWQCDRDLRCNAKSFAGFILSVLGCCSRPRD
jgi:hypothetical protein